MKQSFTYKAISVFLTFLVLFSSTSYSIEKHICEGEVHTSFFEDAENLCAIETATCHATDSKTNCCASELEESDCCLNTSEFIKGIVHEQQAQIEQKISIAPIIVLFSSYFSTRIQLLQTTFQKHIFIKYPPKFLDLGILFQVFII